MPDTPEPVDTHSEYVTDVSLAIDFAAIAVRKEFEVGISVSAETDLRPALEFVTQACDESGTYYPRAEVAAWGPIKGRRSPRLRLPERTIYCHMVDQDGYIAVTDPVDYI